MKMMKEYRDDHWCITELADDIPADILQIFSWVRWPVLQSEESKLSLSQVDSVPDLLDLISIAVSWPEARGNKVYQYLDAFHDHASIRIRSTVAEIAAGQQYNDIVKKSIEAGLTTETIDFLKEKYGIGE